GFTMRGADGQYYANVQPAAGAIVWGVVYRCTPAAMAWFDEFEGVASGDYYRTTVEIELVELELVELETVPVQLLTAEIYIAGDRFVCASGTPNPLYLARIVRGARRHRLPESHIHQIEQLGGGRAFIG